MAHTHAHTKHDLQERFWRNRTATCMTETISHALSTSAKTEAKIHLHLDTPSPSHQTLPPALTKHSLPLSPNTPSPSHQTLPPWAITKHSLVILIEGIIIPPSHQQPLHIVWPLCLKGHRLATTGGSHVITSIPPPPLFPKYSSSPSLS